MDAAVVAVAVADRNRAHVSHHHHQFHPLLLLPGNEHLGASLMEVVVVAVMINWPEREKDRFQTGACHCHGSEQLRVQEECSEAVCAGVVVSWFLFCRVSFP